MKDMPLSNLMGVVGKVEGVMRRISATYDLPVNSMGRDEEFIIALPWFVLARHFEDHGQYEYLPFISSAIVGICFPRDNGDFWLWRSVDGISHRPANGDLTPDVFDLLSMGTLIQRRPSYDGDSFRWYTSACEAMYDLLTATMQLAGRQQEEQNPAPAQTESAK